eukprot:6176444-Pleurochrysis_carterae.AAC.4
MVKTPQSVARAVRSRAPMMRTDEAPALERVLATLPYVLPAIDGFAYGLYVYQNVPPIGAIAGRPWALGMQRSPRFPRVVLYAKHEKQPLQL